MYYQIVESVAVDAIQYTAKFSPRPVGDSDNSWGICCWSLKDLQEYFKVDLCCTSFIANYVEDEFYGFAEIPFESLIETLKFETPL
jgi:hypothetical protein